MQARARVRSPAESGSFRIALGFAAAPAVFFTVGRSTDPSAVGFRGRAEGLQALVPMCLPGRETSREV